jgi:hypothetical protein
MAHDLLLRPLDAIFGVKACRDETNAFPNEKLTKGEERACD